MKMKQKKLIKKKKTSGFDKKETDCYKKHTRGYQWKEERGRGKIGLWD